MEPPGAIPNLNQVQEQASQSGVFADGTPWSMPANLIYRALDWNFNNMQNPTTWKAARLVCHRRAQHEVRYSGRLQPHGRL